MTELVAMHIDDPQNWGLLTSNLENLLADLPTAKVEVVINGPAISLYLQATTAKFVAAHPTVRFDACQHAMRSHRIESTQLPETVVEVAGGISQLVKLQQNGYAYLKP